MHTVKTFTIDPLGPFDLRRLATFGFGHRHRETFDGTMTMAFLADDHQTSVGVAIQQHNDGSMKVDVQTDSPRADLDMICAQTKRILSLDHDADAFLELGKQDPILGRLQQLAPGLRPPLFHSPYEAATWSIISARRSAIQMTKVRDALCCEHGVVFDVAGQSLAAFPTPTNLVTVERFPGLDATKIERLHGVARAAENGLLNVDHLHSIGPETAMKELQQIVGIGPFYAALIVVRASGFADVLAEEPKALELAAKLYGRPFTFAQFAQLAEQWKPFRTWVMVYIRSTGQQLLDETNG
jgi:DNA-3-methyladenine glycosylase II